MRAARRAVVLFFMDVCLIKIRMEVKVSIWLNMPRWFFECMKYLGTITPVFQTIVPVP